MAWLILAELRQTAQTIEAAIQYKLCVLCVGINKGIALYFSNHFY